MAENRSAHPLWQLTLTRLLEFWRSPGAIFWTFIFPVILAVALGIAFQNRGQEELRIVVTGSYSRALLDLLSESPGLLVIEADEEDASRLLARGKVDLVVVADHPGDQAPLVLRFDPDRPEGTTVRLLVAEAIQRAHGRADPVTLEDDPVVQGGSRYIDFLIPGLIGLNIMSSCMWGIGYAVVDQRKRKLLKRFAATPMNRSHYLMSFMLSRLVFLVLEVALLLLFGWLVFDVVNHGARAAVWTVALLGAFAFSGMSLLVAARTDSTEVASGWMNFAMLPMYVVSGAFFDYSRFPEFLHPVIRALPLTAVNDALRGIINHGDSLATLWLEVLVLALWGSVCFVVSLRIFKWQ
jgi:ABC-type polysaccharide/polyol phosphate export permease